jgi:DNA gyrase/topoisomerase IV subunit A
MDRTKEAKEYAELVSEIDDLNALLGEKKRRRDELQESLLEWFTDPDSPDRVTIAGRTLFPRRQVWVNAKTQDALAALKEHGLVDMVKESVNSQTLSAWYRELEEEDAVPDWAKEKLDVAEVYKVSARKEN